MVNSKVSVRNNFKVYNENRSSKRKIYSEITNSNLEVDNIYYKYKN